MIDPLRARRWCDFRRRIEFAPESVYLHRSGGWTYIPIHPFADEAADLARLGIAPEDCWGVDAWWGIEGDATLVQSCIARPAHRPPGLYARRTEHDQGWVYLIAVLDVPAITRESFEAALSRFASLGFPDGERFRLDRDAGLVRVDA
jgi:hypothetical protein